MNTKSRLKPRPRQWQDKIVRSAIFQDQDKISLHLVLSRLVWNPRCVFSENWVCIRWKFGVSAFRQGIYRGESPGVGHLRLWDSQFSLTCRNKTQDVWSVKFFLHHKQVFDMKLESINARVHLCINSASKSRRRIQVQIFKRGLLFQVDEAMAESSIYIYVVFLSHFQVP